MEKQIVHLFVFNALADWETGFAIAGINNPAAQNFDAVWIALQRAHILGQQDAIAHLIAH